MVKTMSMCCPLAVVGLENSSLQLFLLGISFVVALWGFARYRQTFSKTELGLALLISFGILTVGVLPDIYGGIAGLLDIESRFLVITLIANVIFIFLFLYVLRLINRNNWTITRLSRQLAVSQDDVAGTPDEDSIYVVIPAYNEADTIEPVVTSLPSTVCGYSVHAVVVSDGSDDGTRRVAERIGCTVVEHPINQGQGGALKTGFQIARRNDADVVVTMDADGQHPVSQLSDIVRPITENEADYVIGSRYLGEDESNNPVSRELGIRTFTGLINLMANADITDCTNGYRAIRGSQLAELTLTEERFSAPELIIEAQKNGLRITEVPVTIKPRDAGETKKPQVGYAVGLLRTIFVTWIR
jgi:hypothetical protein